MRFSAGRLPVPRRRRSAAIGLEALARHEFLTPRAEFGSSEDLGPTLARTPDGLYLVLAPHLGAGEPVRSVGWANNDHWAVRVWGRRGHGSTNDHDPDAAGGAMPVVDLPGWPRPLAYGSACAHAREGRPAGRIVVAASYDGLTGAFLSHRVQASDRVTFHFADANPEPDDLAVAVEVVLGGPRRAEFLAEIAEVNEVNRRAGRP